MANSPHVTYPGVYVQEIASDVQTIAPVETATTAFIGRALRGPVNEPVVISSFSDYQSIFGGLWKESAMSYSVSAFFLNGGSKAAIVRLINAATKAEITVDTLTLEARNEGAWGNYLRARVTLVNPHVGDAVAKQLNFDATDLFHLAVHDVESGATELFENVTMVAGPRQIDQVLRHASTLVRVKGELASSSLAVPRPHAEPTADPVSGRLRGVWEDPAASDQPTSVPGLDGDELTDAIVTGTENPPTGIYALDCADFNILCIPLYNAGDVAPVVWTRAAAYCEKRRAMLLVNPPSSWTTADSAIAGFPIPGFAPSKNAAIFFPNVKAPDPLLENQVREFSPSGAIAGIFARTDGQRGVWKAPAGIAASLHGVTSLAVALTETENGNLNPLGINCLRTFPATGHIVWGARTMVGNDRLGSEWKYIPVRRTALFLEASIYRGTQWAVFEPNAEPLWSQLRLNIGVFMHGLFQQGAFQGSSPTDAYFVKCDATTTSQADIDQGMVNILVGFAPSRPAEFVVLYIQQVAGQLAT